MSARRAIAATLTARTIVALMSHSVVVYFLQPSLATMLVAGAFLLSVPLDRPLACRLALECSQNRAAS